MDKKEYYKRIEKINNRFKTDRVGADEEYQLVCQKNYLSTKYMFLEQQCKKQKEVMDKAINRIVKETKSMPTNGCKIRLIEILEILNEVKDDKKKEE